MELGISKYNIIGITGNAGAGKTRFANQLRGGGNFDVYSIDWRFIGDSDFRKALLGRKSKNIDSYIDAINQFSWWDWDQVEKDILSYKNTGTIRIETPYDRDAGESQKSVIEINSSKLIVEGAILGTPAIIERLEHIFFLHIPFEERFGRIVKKDKGRRSLKKIMIRCLITEYSESLHYQFLLNRYGNKMTFLDVNHHPIAFLPDDKIYQGEHYVPVKMVI